MGIVTEQKTRADRWNEQRTATLRVHSRFLADAAMLFAYGQTGPVAGVLDGDNLLRAAPVVHKEYLPSEDGLRVWLHPLDGDREGIVITGFRELLGYWESPRVAVLSLGMDDEFMVGCGAVSACEDWATCAFIVTGEIWDLACAKHLPSDPTVVVTWGKGKVEATWEPPF